MHAMILRRAHRCNEVGYFQDGAPLGHPSLVTRLVQPAYDEVRNVLLWFTILGVRLEHR